MPAGLPCLVMTISPDSARRRNRERSSLTSASAARRTGPPVLRKPPRRFGLRDDCEDFDGVTRDVIVGLGEAVERGPGGSQILAEGDAVAVDDPLAEHRGHAGAGRDDAGEVERVAGGEADDLAARGVTANGAEGVERFGIGELLSDEAGDDTPAAQLAAHLQAAVDAQEIPPGGSAGLALEEIAEDAAVAPHVLARAGFQEIVRRRRRGRGEERPAPGSDGRAKRPLPAGAKAPALLRVEQAAE